MRDKLLVVYASKYGSTKEIAEYIGDVIREGGVDVDVLSVNEVKDMSTYKSVIIGSATRMEKLVADAVKFSKRYKSELSDKKTAYFVVGVTMKEDTDGNREKARGYLKPLCQIKEPVSVGLFAGKIDYDKIGRFWRMLASRDKTDLMEEGDFRNWDAIREWANGLIPLFSSLHDL